MKNRTESNLRNLLQSLGLVSLIFFAMAFACKDDTKTDSGKETGSERQSPSKNKTKSEGGGKCSTEDEFKELLTATFSQTYNERDGKFKDTEVEFQTFDIGEPFHYKNSYPIVDAENAYPVETDYISHDYLHGNTSPEIFEKKAKNFKYVFYVDHHGDCVFAATPGTSETKHIPYEK